MPGVPYAVSAGDNGEPFAFVVAGRSVTEWASSNGGSTMSRCAELEELRSQAVDELEKVLCTELRGASSQRLACAQNQSSRARNDLGIGGL